VENVQKHFASHTQQAMIPNQEADEPRPVGLPSSNRGGHSMPGPGPEYRIDPREVKARMDTPLVKTVLDMGFEKNLVQTVVEEQLKKNGDDFQSAENLLEAILIKSESNENPALEIPAAHTSVSNIPAPQPEPNQNTNTTETSQTSVATPTKSKVSKNRKKKERKKAKAAAAKASESQTKENSPSSEEDAIADINQGNMDGVEMLLQEKKKWEEQRMCKVCMDSDVNVVFLPCGHLCCCSNCAPSLSTCPMCRTFIKGTVRTYFS